MSSRRACPGRISGEVAEALPSADWRQVGWGAFALAANLALNVEAFAGYVRTSIPPAHVLKGARGGAQLTCQAGEALISRGEQAARNAPHATVTFTVGEGLVKTRSGLVTAAESILDVLVVSAELKGTLIETIRGHGRGPDDDGMVAMITRALPGLDRAQAGWGLLVCGTSVLAFADEAASAAKPGRWAPRRRSKDDAELLGISLVGSVIAIAGDALISQSPATR
jgi:hypothetical protein